MCVNLQWSIVLRWPFIELRQFAVCYQQCSLPFASSDVGYMPAAVFDNTAVVALPVNDSPAQSPILWPLSLAVLHTWIQQSIGLSAVYYMDSAILIHRTLCSFLHGFSHSYPLNCQQCPWIQPFTSIELSAANKHFTPFYLPTLVSFISVYLCIILGPSISSV